MRLPASVKAIRTRWVAAKGIPQQQDGESSEAWESRLRDTWTVPFDEQVAFEEGSEWGAKRSSPTNPLGKDTIARRVNGRLWVFDLLTGAGTGQPTLNDDPEGEDITGQFFETRPEFFKPTNHLGNVIIPAPTTPILPLPTEPIPSLPSVDLGPLLARLETLEHENQDRRAEIRGAHDRIDKLPPPVMPPLPALKARGSVSLNDVLRGRQVEWDVKP